MVSADPPRPGREFATANFDDSESALVAVAVAVARALTVCGRVAVQVCDPGSGRRQRPSRESRTLSIQLAGPR